MEESLLLDSTIFESIPTSVEITTRSTSTSLQACSVPQEHAMTFEQPSSPENSLRYPSAETCVGL